MSRPDHLSLGLKLLGQSHSRYGVLKEHYPIVLSALLETIKEELGEFYTDQLINAWEQALTIITNEMKKYA